MKYKLKNTFFILALPICLSCQPLKEKHTQSPLIKFFPEISSYEKVSLSTRVEDSEDKSNFQLSNGQEHKKNPHTNSFLSGQLHLFKDFTFFADVPTVVFGGSLELYIGVQYDFLKTREYKIGIGASFGGEVFGMQLLFSKNVLRIESNQMEFNLFSDLQFRRGHHTDILRVSSDPESKYYFIERFDKVSFIAGLNVMKSGVPRLSLTVYGGLEKTVSKKLIAAEAGDVSYHRTDSPVAGIVLSFGI